MSIVFLVVGLGVLVAAGAAGRRAPGRRWSRVTALVLVGVGVAVSAYGAKGLEQVIGGWALPLWAVLDIGAGLAGRHLHRRRRV